ncbi:WNT1-inducible-signaling pathway protein 3 [Oryzias latipes]|uniref:CCN family member 3 n=1 Tax=Oryzias latipes TaxID=8090 RepID=H2MUT9_ORYLA|nr:WNT1-inducible-signaling pathway protein 3 [Oryzias latipes]
MLSLLSLTLLLILAHQPISRAQKQRLQFCRWPCSCPEWSACAPGVSSVLDGCGCCKSCARQFGEPCNERDVCDPHRGLYCDFSADKPRYQVGKCAYMMGVGCDLNGIHYNNGEVFQPSPLYNCTCIAGAIGCMPVFIQKPAGILGASPLTGRKHLQDTTYMSVYRDPPLTWKRNCLIQTTPWSPCSKTCGMGISVRITNDNGKCEMRKDSRLCLLRPCDKGLLKSVKMPKGKTCQPKFQAKVAEKLSLSGCTSTKKFRPTYCGICTDQRCCVPNKSSMIRVDFSCRGGSDTQWKMQWITSCVCQRKCSNPGDMFSDLQLL